MGATQIVLANSPDKFLEFIYGAEEGYCYIGLKEPIEETEKPFKSVDINWEKHHFQWPQQREAIRTFILEKSKDWEVYYSPALFKTESALKKDVKGSRVLWCEFDGNTPDDAGDLPEPSLKVRSSLDGHEHWYWVLDKFSLPYDVEKVNRAITYAFKADSSGWDANQVLRPVGTYNHKRKKKVELLHWDPTAVVSIEQFGDLPEPPPKIEAPPPEKIPAVEEIIWAYPFTDHVQKLFREGKEWPNRSEGLMELGYWLAEMQMADEEIFAMLLHADMRWGKFAGRNDQYQRLMEIVVRARLKYPQEDVPETQKLMSMGFQTLLNTEYSLEWILEGILQEKGYMLFTGHSGVGKTQFMMEMAAKLALGREFLGKAVQKPRKIGFFSLEMGLEDFKYFAEHQARAYSTDELQQLEEMFRVFPYGEPLYLGSDTESSRIREVIEREELELVVFDSLGSTTEEALSDERTAKKLMDWNDKLRQELGIATAFIHHHRKATADNRKPNKLSDVYGSHYYTARATSVLTLWETSLQNTLELLKLKIRLSPDKAGMELFRDNDLHFHMKSGITFVDEKEEEKEPEKNGSKIPSLKSGIGFTSATKIGDI